MISRRSFLKGGATAAIGAGAAMSLGGCSPKAEGGALLQRAHPETA